MNFLVQYLTLLNFKHSGNVFLFMLILYAGLLLFRVKLITFLWSSLWRGTGMDCSLPSLTQTIFSSEILVWGWCWFIGPMLLQRNRTTILCGKPKLKHKPLILLVLKRKLHMFGVLYYISNTLSIINWFFSLKH